MPQPIEDDVATEEFRASMAAAKAAPTEHHHRLVTSGHVWGHIGGTGAMGQFNNRLAVLITKIVGTMWAAYLFLLISLISFPQALSALLRGDTVTGISWLSQSFLQLILLPIIIVGQNVISAAQDERASADHVTLTVLHTINVQQLQLLQQQEKILEALQHRTDASPGARETNRGDGLG
jgi:hypothetical protein